MTLVTHLDDVFEGGGKEGGRRGREGRERGREEKREVGMEEERKDNVTAPP